MTREERDVADIKERVSRLVGDIRPSDLHVVRLVVTGDPDEDVYVLPAARGRYRTLSPKQKRQILELMAADGFEWDGDHWKRLLTPEQLQERDKGETPLTPEELVSDEDRPPVIT